METSIEPDGTDVLRLAHIDLLAGIDVFASLDRVDLARLAAYLEPHGFSDGDVLFHQGDTGDSLYIVTDGRVCVYSTASDSGTQTEFATLGPGQYFGEIALILSEPRTASVRAIGDIEVLRLERDRFLELIGRNPRVALTVTTKIIGHLRTADDARTHGGGIARSSDLSPPSQRAPVRVPVGPPGSAPESTGGSPLRSRAYVVAAAGFGVAAGVAKVSGSGSAEVFLLLLGAAAMLWASSLLTFAAVGLALVAAWLVFGLTTPQQAMAGFASSSWLFVLCILCLTAALARSGLLFRVGLLMVRRLPAGLAWQASGLLVTGVALGALIPSSTARIGLMSPLALAVSQALRQRERGPGAALLGLAAWIGAGPMLFAFLNASSVNLVAWGLLPAAARARTDWIHWFIAVLPLVVIIGGASLLLLVIRLRPPVSGGTPTRRLGLQLAVLGPLQRREQAMLAILAFTLVGWLAGPSVGIQPSTVALIALLGAFLSGNFDRQALRDLNWDYLLFFGVVLGIAEVSTTLGVDRLVAEAIGAPLAATGISGPMFVIAIGVLMGLVRVFLVADQAVLLLALALIPIAPALGVDPFLVVVPLSCMALVWYMPSQSPEYLLAYTLAEGKLFSQEQSRAVAVWFAALVLVSLVLVMPYWRWLGLV